MKSKINFERLFAILFGIAALILCSTNLNAQFGMHKGHSGHGSHNEKIDSTISHNEKIDSTISHNEKIDSTIIRMGVIDVKALDLNEDGYVYQCEMHPNVIGDYKYKCPNCDMILEEVSLKKAMENLKTNGFNVK